MKEIKQETERIIQQYQDTPAVPLLRELINSALRLAYAGGLADGAKNTLDNLKLENLRTK